MNWLILGIFVALLNFLHAEGNVIDLTDENFDEYIKKYNVIMVEFYAPWCGHCKAFAPEYETAAKIFRDNGRPFVLAKLDATVNKKAAEKFKVKGFPTIKLFLSGMAIDYNGDRKATNVMAFILKKTNPPSTQLKTVAAVTEQKGAKGHRVISLLIIK